MPGGTDNYLSKQYANLTHVLRQSFSCISFLRTELESSELRNMQANAKLENCQSQLCSELTKSRSATREIEKLKTELSRHTSSIQPQTEELDITFDVSPLSVNSPKRSFPSFFPSAPPKESKIKITEEKAYAHSPKRRITEEKAFAHSPKRRIPEEKAYAHSPRYTIAEEKTYVHSPNVLSPVVKKPLKFGNLFSAKCKIPKTISLDSLNMKANGPPFVPPAIAACMKEIEIRGNLVPRLYSDSSSTKEVVRVQNKLHTAVDMKSLLAGTDLKVISSCMKMLINCVSEPLVTEFHRSSFIDLLTYKNHDKEAKILEACRGLPTVNRDTLVFLMLHLKRISDGMTKKEDLCDVFAPIVLGTFKKIDGIVLHQQRYREKLVLRMMMEQTMEFWKGVMEGGCIDFGKFDFLGSYLSKK